MQAGARPPALDDDDLAALFAEVVRPPDREGGMTALRTEGLGRRYGAKWALRDCTLEIPEGTVTALVGPNGAGKTTLLQIAVGLCARAPGASRCSACDRATRRASCSRASASSPRSTRCTRASRWPRRSSSAAGSTRPGTASWPARGSTGWASTPSRRWASCRGGQQAQVALTLALAKRPELLLLDEPVASLDPLARREFMSTLMEAVGEGGLTVVLSSHIVADLERVCDHLVILSQARTVLAGPIEEIVASHRLLTGPRSDPETVARVHQVIRESHTAAPDDAARPRERPRLRRGLGAAPRRPGGDRARLPRL